MIKNLGLICENWINAGYYGEIDSKKLTFYKKVPEGYDEYRKWVNFDLNGCTYEIKGERDEPVDMDLHTLIRATCKLLEWVE